MGASDRNVVSMSWGTPRTKTSLSARFTSEIFTGVPPQAHESRSDPPSAPATGASVRHDRVAEDQVQGAAVDDREAAVRQRVAILAQADEVPRRSGSRPAASAWVRRLGPT